MSAAVNFQARIRRMQATDVEAAVALAAELPTAPHWKAELYLSTLAAGVAVVAEAAGGMAGFAVASVIAPQAELESIVVAPEFQRMGVARRLFEALAGELVAAGVEEVLLEVRASNDAALGFYRSLGFEETGRRPGYYSSPVEDALLLRKGIS
jgi:ribosomal-protein-alanine N-acetyltransferase